MKSFSIFLFLIAISALTSKLHSQDLSKDSADTLMNKQIFNGKKFKDGLIQGRYMAENPSKNCSEKTVEFPKWDASLPLQKCNYIQYDKTPDGKYLEKRSTVIMLNPEKQVLAKWIIASCQVVVAAKDIDRCAEDLAFAVIDASGSQFVIAGLVYEDQRGVNGLQESYAFRDGVTVRLVGGLEKGVDCDQPFTWEGDVTASDVELALKPDTKVACTASNSGPARIQNTTRKMYTDYINGRVDVSGLKWLDVVRESYQDAWKRAHNEKLSEGVQKYKNDLMIAKCYDLMRKNDIATHL